MIVTRPFTGHLFILTVHSIVFRVDAFYMARAPTKDLGYDTLHPRSRVRECVGKTPLIRRPSQDLPQKRFHSRCYHAQVYEENPNGRVGSIKHYNWQY